MTLSEREIVGVLCGFRWPFTDTPSGALVLYHVCELWLGHAGPHTCRVDHGRSGAHAYKAVEVA